MNDSSIALNAETIHRLLKKLGFEATYKLHCFDEIHSSNRFLYDLPSKPFIQCCITEAQTAGRGRFGRHWHSPQAENIYFSGRWPWKKDLAALSGLSLVIGLAVLDILQPKLKQDKLMLKWPNDILWQGQKLGGILIELKTDHDGTDLIIGIGLNINSSNQNAAPITQAWCSLYDITQQFTERNGLIAQLLHSLQHNIQLYEKEGFKIFQSRWNEVDYLKNQSITVTQSTGALTGTACGVTDQGLLRLLVGVDNSSLSSLRPATCSRDPETLTNTQTFCVEVDQTGCLGQAEAGRPGGNCQHVLDNSKNILTLSAGETSINQFNFAFPSLYD